MNKLNTVIAFLVVFLFSISLVSAAYPVINLTSITFPEDITNLTNLSLYVSNVSAASDINWSVSANSNNVTVSVSNITKILNITPLANFTTDLVSLINLTLTARDLDGNSTTAYVSINITNVNDAPIFNAVINQSVIQDSTLTLNISNFTRDIDPNNNLTYSMIGNGSINSTTGIYTWTPNYQNYGWYTFLFNATDTSGESALQNVSIYVYGTLNITGVTFNSVNINKTQLVQSVHPGDSISIVINTFNVGSNTIDNVNLTLDSALYSSSIFTPGNWSQVPSTNRTFSFSLPTLMNESIYNISIRAEGKNHWPEYIRYDYFNFSINVTKNEDDIIIESLSLSGNNLKCVGQTNLTVNVTNKGLKNYTDITLRVYNSSLGFSNTTYNLSLVAGNYNDTLLFDINTGNKTAGNYTIMARIDYYISYLTNITYTKNITLTIVNCEPNVTTIPSVIFAEDTYNDSINLSSYFWDFNNDILTYAVVGNTTNLSFNTFSSTGRVNITANANFNGTRYINFTAYDSRNTTNSGEILVNITPVNDAPIVTAISNQSIQQGNNFTYQVQATDVENDTLNYSININDTIPLAINQSGYIYNFTPNNSHVGKNYLVNVTVCDANCSNRSFVLTVTNLNDAPTIAQVANQTVNEDSLLQFQLIGADIDNDTLTYSCNLSALNTTKINNTLANVTWTPTNSYVGNHSINCSVTDSSSARNYTLFIIEVNNTNDAPTIATIPNATKVVGQTFTYQVNASDVDVGDSLSYSLPVNDSGMTINGSGYISGWTANLSYINSPVNVVVNVCDNSNNCTNASFRITVQNSLVINTTIIAINGINYSININETKNVKPYDAIVMSFKINSATNISHLIVNGTLVRNNGSSVMGTGYYSVDGFNVGSSQGLQFDFGNLPYNADNNETFNISLVAYERDQPSSIVDRWNAILRVDSNTHDIKILSVSLTNTTLSCNRSNNMIVNVSNKGVSSETVNITLTNTSLGLSVTSTAQTIAAGSSALFTVPFNVSGSVAAGSYSISVSAQSNYATDSSSKTLALTSCSITFSPEPNSITLLSTTSQIFNVSYNDLTNVNIVWEKNGVVVGNGSNYTSTFSNSSYLHCSLTANNGVSADKYWNIAVYNYPHTTVFNSAGSTDFSNVSNLSNVVNATLVDASGNKIQFLDNVNFTSVVDIDNIFKVTNRIVAVDSALYTALSGKRARITLTGLTSTLTPTIYYNSTFTTNPSYVNATNCTWCTIISYSSGTLVFEVPSFSSYRASGGSSTPSTPSTTNPNQSAVLTVKKVNADPNDPKPDESVEVKVKIENNGDVDINNIDLEVRILDENGDVVEDIDGDDLEDDTDFDLSNDDSQEETFTFRMPIDAKDSDEYTIDIVACGENDDNGSDECAYDDSEKIKMNRESHEVVIESATISPSSISCFDSFDINLVAKDIGKKDETVQLTVTSDELDISKTESFDLEADDSDNYKKSLSYAFSTPEDLEEGDYIINLKIDYSDKTETKTLQLTKKACSTHVAEEEPTKETPVIVTLDKNNVVSTPAPEPIQIAAAKKTAKFTDSFEYVIMLIILSIATLGLITFAIGAVIIKL